MTRLNEAFKRAAGKEAAPLHFSPALLDEEPSAAWQFSVDDTVSTPPVVPASSPPPARSAVKESVPAPQALISRFSQDERPKMVVGEHADPALVEQYRHLAAVLHKAQGESGYRSVMVTSALPSEGKTLTAANLALTLSHSYQRRVLLVDADLRRPRLQRMLGLSAGPGLTDSLVLPRGGKLPVHKLSPTLWVLGAGRSTADPMSTLASTSMKQLLDDAKDAFDWVIVDTPPIAILPDANLLAAMVDTALLVVCAQSTPYPMVQRAAEAIGTTRILGVVLNRAEREGLAKEYGYYGGNLSAGSRPKPRRRWTAWFKRSRGAPHVR